jgi:hypothetical protein
MGVLVFLYAMPLTWTLEWIPGSEIAKFKGLCVVDFNILARLRSGKIVLLVYISTNRGWGPSTLSLPVAFITLEGEWLSHRLALSNFSTHLLPTCSSEFDSCLFLQCFGFFKFLFSLFSLVHINTMKTFHMITLYRWYSILWTGSPSLFIPLIRKSIWSKQMRKYIRPAPPYVWQDPAEFLL